MSKLIDKNESTYINIFYIFITIAVLFGLSPLLVSIFIISLFILTGISEDKVALLIIILFSFSLSWLSSLKIPEGDLKTYISIYKQAASNNYLSFLLIEKKDSLFYSITYYIYYISSGSSQFFIFFWYFFVQMNISIAIWKISKEFKILNSIILCSIALLFLIPEIYSLIGHIIRQFAALAVVLLAMSFYITKASNLKVFLILLVASFLHFSAMIFILLFLLSMYLEKKSNLVIVLLILITFLISFFNWPKYLSGHAEMFSSLVQLNYILSRLDSDLLRDNNGLLTWKSYLLIIFNIIVAYYYHLKVKKNSSSRKLLSFYLSLFLIVLLVSRIPLLYLRFSFYTYGLLGISLSLFLSVIKLKEKRILLSIGILLLSFRFTSGISNSVWSYDFPDNNPWYVSCLDIIMKYNY